MDEEKIGERICELLKQNLTINRNISDKLAKIRSQSVQHYTHKILLNEQSSNSFKIKKLYKYLGGSAVILAISAFIFSYIYVPNAKTNVEKIMDTIQTSVNKPSIDRNEAIRGNNL